MNEKNRLEKCPHFNKVYAYCLVCKIEKLEQKLKILTGCVEYYADMRGWEGGECAANALEEVEKIK